MIDVTLTGYPCTSITDGITLSCPSFVRVGPSLNITCRDQIQKVETDIFIKLQEVKDFGMKVFLIRLKIVEFLDLSFSIDVIASESCVYRTDQNQSQTIRNMESTSSMDVITKVKFR